MKKKSLLALLMALTLILSGCTLVQKDTAVDNAQVVLSLGDKTVSKAEVLEYAEEVLSYYSYMYSMYGYSYDVTDADNIADARDEAVDYYTDDLVMNAKIEELGLGLTEEEEAEVQTTAQETYDSYVEQLKSYYFEDTELTGDELTAALDAKMVELGYTLESIADSERDTKLSEKLQEYAVKDVTVTEEEIKEVYDSKVESHKETYSDSASSYCSAVNYGTTIYYAPAGVRLVKQILIKFTDEDQAILDALEDRIDTAEATLDNEEATEEEKTAAQAEKDAAEAELTAAQETAWHNLDAEADDVMLQLTNGADWDTLMAEKTQDPGMQSGDTSVRGYAVCEGMTKFDSAFVDAAMALQKIGDVSGKTRSTMYGYYIIKYVGDVAEGAIDYDSVKDTCAESALSTKQTTVYSETQQKWIDESGIKIDTSVLDN